MQEIPIEQIDNVKILESKGLEDGGTVIVKCSNCKAPLAEFWITRPNEEFTWKVVVKCPHCGDKSYKTKISGGLHYGPTDFTLPEGNELIDKETGEVILVGTKLKEWIR